MIRKILSLILCMAICLSVMPVSMAYASDDEDYQRASELLAALGVSKGITLEPADKITRAEFVALAVRMLNLSHLSEADGSFEDIDSKHPFAAEIYTARDLRMSMGTSEGIFSPDDEVPSAVAAKIALTAMGFENVAVAKGGYPYGYLKIASETDLFLGTDTSGNLSVRDAFVVIYNALNSYIPVFDEIENDTLGYNFRTDASLLTENFDLKKISGVVEKAGYMSTVAGSPIDETVVVGNSSYVSNIDVTKYLGRSVFAWIDETEKVIYAMTEGYNNREAVIDAENVYKYSRYVLEVYEEQKTKTYTMESDFIFIKNGRAISHTSADFKFDTGYLRLIDNDGNGKYEYVLAENTKYFIVSRINLTNMIIHDSKSEYKSISFDVEDDKVYKLVDMDGKSIGIEKLSVGSLLEVMKSDDSEVLIARLVSGNTVNAVVTESSDEMIIADGVEYQKSEYFKSKAPFVSLGSTYTLILGSNGDLVDLTAGDETNMRYGYLINFGSNGSGMSSKLQMKVLTTDNTREVYDLSEYVILDGVKKSRDSSDVLNKFIFGATPKYQIIRYKLNSRGEMTTIDTAKVNDNWLIERGSDDNNALTNYVSAPFYATGGMEDVYYRTNSRFAIPKFSLDNVVIFMVPKALHAAITHGPGGSEDISIDPSKLTADIKEENFYVTNTSGLIDKKKYYVDAFDFDDNYRPAVCTIYDANIAGQEIQQEHTSFIVQKIADTLDEEGAACKAMYVFGDGKYSKLYIDKDCLGTLPNAGDVIRYSINGKGKVGIIETDFDYNPIDKTVTNNTMGAPTDYMSYAMGNVIRFGDNVITLSQAALADSGKNTNMGVNEILAIPTRGSTNYIVFNKTSNEVRAAGADEILCSEDFTQPENGSFVACRLYYYMADSVFIYVD